MLGGFFGGRLDRSRPAAPTAVVNIPPVDLAQRPGRLGRPAGRPVRRYLGPRAPAHVRSSLEQLGLGGSARMFGRWPAPQRRAAAAAVQLAQPGPAADALLDHPG